MIIKLTIPIEGKEYIITGKDIVIAVFADEINTEVREFMDLVAHEDMFAIVFTLQRGNDTHAPNSAIFNLTDCSFAEDIITNPYFIRFVIGFGDSGKVIAHRFSNKNKETCRLTNTASFKMLYKNMGRNILIQMEEGIGDILMTLPTVRAYTRMDYKVDLLTIPEREPVLNGIKYINKIYTKREDIDYQRYKLRYNPSGKLSNYDQKYCQQHRVFTIANLCGLDNDLVKNDMLPDICLTEEELKEMKKRIQFNNKTVALILESVHTKHRSLPEEKIQQLIDELQRIGYLPVVLHSKRRNYYNCLNLTGTLTIRQFMAMIAVCNKVVTVDTCAIQIAAALRKSIILISSLINPLWRIYPESSVEIIKTDHKCYPCSELYTEERAEECRHLLTEYPPCIKDIDIHQIVDIVKKN